MYDVTMTVQPSDGQHSERGMGEFPGWSAVRRE